MESPVAQTRTWTDERDGERWLLVRQYSECPAAISLEFKSQSERRAVMVVSNILLDALTDQEIRGLLDRAQRESVPIIRR